MGWLVACVFLTFVIPTALGFHFHRRMNAIGLFAAVDASWLTGNTSEAQACHAVVEGTPLVGAVRNLDRAGKRLDALDCSGIEGWDAIEPQAQATIGDMTQQAYERVRAVAQSQGVLPREEVQRMCDAYGAARATIGAIEQAASEKDTADAIRKSLEALAEKTALIGTPAA